MDEIIDLSKKRMERDTSLENKVTCDDGSMWFKYFAEFEFDCAQGDIAPIIEGAIYPKTKRYMIEFWAQDDEEAKERVEAMRSTMVFGGRLL